MLKKIILMLLMTFSICNSYADNAKKVGGVKIVPDNLTLHTLEFSKGGRFVGERTSTYRDTASAGDVWFVGDTLFRKTSVKIDTFMANRKLILDDSVINADGVTLTQYEDEGDPKIKLSDAYKATVDANSAFINATDTDGNNAIDVLQDTAFSNFVKRGVQVAGGGEVTWDSTTHTLTWSATIVIRMPKGGDYAIAAGSHTFAAGDWAYVSTSEVSDVFLNEDYASGTTTAYMLDKEYWLIDTDQKGCIVLGYYASKWHPAWPCLIPKIDHTMIADDAMSPFIKRGIVVQADGDRSFSTDYVLTHPQITFIMPKGGAYNVGADTVKIKNNYVLYLSAAAGKHSFTAVDEDKTTNGVGYFATTSSTELIATPSLDRDQEGFIPVAVNRSGVLFCLYEAISPYNNSIFRGLSSITALATAPKRGVFLYNNNQEDLPTWDDATYLYSGVYFNVSLPNGGGYGVLADTITIPINYTLCLSTNSDGSTFAALNEDATGWSAAYLCAVPMETANSDRAGFIPLAVNRDGKLYSHWEAVSPYPNTLRTTSITVNKDHTGTYTTVDSALTKASNGLAGSHEYDILIGKGIYDEENLELRDGIHLRGEDKDQCWIRGYLPASTDSATLVNTSTLNIDNGGTSITAWLENLTISIQNGRYAIHADPGSSNLTSKLYIKNCRIIHYGNEESVASQSAHYWGTSSCDAIGSGFGGGQYIYAENTSLEAYNAPFSAHSSATEVNEMSIAEFVGCNFNRISHPDTIDVAYGELSFRWNPMDSHNHNKIIFRNCYFNAPILIQAGQRSIANYPKDMITMSGCNNVPLRKTLPGVSEGFVIESDSVGEGSSVSVLSGTAIPVLFDSVYTLAGDSTLSGRAWGRLGVSYGASLLMGARLGNCSSVNKTLVVSVNGGGGQTITFNENFSAQTNDYVLAFINAALDSATADDDYGFADRYYINDLDNMKSLFNSSDMAIHQGMAVKLTARNKIARMTSSDDSTEFYGIALEDIIGGTWGDISTGAYLEDTFINQESYTSAVFGDMYGISATTPGKFDESATPKVIKCDWDGFVKPICE